jgi:hypothetical protein
LEGAKVNDEIDRKKWLVPTLVVMFGCIGGLTTWVWLYATGTPQDGGIGAALATNMFLGAVAGFIGVYVLKVDTSRFVLHTLALALLCGFAWKPTLEAGRAYVVTQTAESEAVEKRDYAINRIEQLRDADPETAPELIRDLESVSQQLIKSEASIRNPRLKLELNSVVIESMEAISDAAEYAPRESAEALGAVEEEAMVRRNMRVSDSARRRLEMLEERRRVDELNERKRRRPEQPD